MITAKNAHLDRVAGLGCVLCKRLGYGYTPPEIHHLREGQGAAQRADNMLSIPLCPEHHRGKSGFHGLGSGAFNRMYRVSEIDLLAEVLEELYG